MSTQRRSTLCPGSVRMTGGAWMGAGTAAVVPRVGGEGWQTRTRRGPGLREAGNLPGREVVLGGSERRKSLGVGSPFPENGGRGRDRDVGVCGQGTLSTSTMGNPRGKSVERPEAFLSHSLPVTGSEATAGTLAGKVSLAPKSTLRNVPSRTEGADGAKAGIRAGPARNRKEEGSQD